MKNFVLTHETMQTPRISASHTSIALTSSSLSVSVTTESSPTTAAASRARIFVENRLCACARDAGKTQLYLIGTRGFFDARPGSTACARARVQSSVREARRRKCSGEIARPAEPESHAGDANDEEKPHARCVCVGR